MTQNCSSVTFRIFFKDMITDVYFFLDDSKIGFTNWAFTSVHFWDENPVGKWRLHIFYKDVPTRFSRSASGPMILKSGNLVFYGTEELTMGNRNNAVDGIGRTRDELDNKVSIHVRSNAAFFLKLSTMRSVIFLFFPAVVVPLLKRIYYL